MPEPRPHTTAWYKMKTKELNNKRIEILFIESYFCQLRIGRKPKPGVLLFRHIEPFITIANDIRCLKY